MKTTHSPYYRQYHKGFILLFAVLIISFVMAVTLSLADSIRKQHTFVSLGSESLRAFNQSDAGLECALYWDRKKTAFKASSTTQITCGGQQFTVGGSDISTFTYLSPDGTQSTDVKVDKSVDGTTTITAMGYNTNDNASNKRVARSLVVTYGNRVATTKCSAFDVALDLDISGSLWGQERIDAADANKLIVDNLQFGPTFAQMAITWFFALTDLQLPLSTNQTQIKKAIDDSYNRAIFGNTNMPGGLIKARNELVNNGRANAPDFIVLVTDGETNECTNAAGDRVFCPGVDHYWDRVDSMAQTVQIAQTIKDEGVTIIVVGVGVQTQGNPPSDPQGVTAAQYTDFLQNKIATPGEYYPVIDASHIKDITGGFDCSFFSRIIGTTTTKEL